MAKTGRNEPCPCGSGKKFKNCHWRVDQEKSYPQAPVGDLRQAFEAFVQEEHMKFTPDEGNSYTRYVQEHEPTHLFNLITALQLDAANHGKNLRLEILAKEALLKSTGNGVGNYPLLQQVINESYPSHYGEDPPEGLFTETVLFHGGNYRLMPGISARSGDILRAITESIYVQENTLPATFKQEVYEGVSLLLELGQKIFERARIPRYYYVENLDNEIVFPPSIEDYSISFADLHEICKSRGIHPLRYKDFITEPDDARLTEDDPELNPLLYRPLIVFKERIYFLLITAQALALNEYIIGKAIEHHCADEFLEIYHQNIWSGVRQACSSMLWKPTNIELPPVSGQLSVFQKVFHIEGDQFALVLQYNHEAIADKYREYEHLLQEKSDKPFTSINEHINEVLQKFRSNAKTNDWKFLVLLLIEDIGRNRMLTIDRSSGDEERLWFGCFEFTQLCHYEQWKPLSLLKYARVYREFSARTFIMSTDPIDAYAVYKNHDESFYIDDRPFNSLTITPGTGADLFREAKQKSDLHGALCFVGEMLAYRLVERYAAYAPIYTTVYESAAYNLLLETYSFPIWIENRQRKDHGNSSFIHYVSEAVLYWLHILSPGLNPLLEQAIKEPLMIELELDDFLFANYTFQELEHTQPDTEFTKDFDGHRLQFRVPGIMLNEWKGKTNSGERILIRELLLAFSLVPGVQLSIEGIEKLLDKYMPLGSQKMILLLDSQLDMQLDKRWLVPVHYISSAETNMLLDRLVSILEYPGSIPETFAAKQEKKNFCNYVVTRLLQYLAGRMANFEGELLLMRLLQLHETLIFKREHNKIIIPAQILCFGQEDEHVQSILKDERKLVITSLSLRSLVELLAANPVQGNKVPSLDELDGMLAVMNEILNYGMISDAIHFELDDPQIGLLPSGRIGIEKSFFETKLKPFSEANQLSDIDDYLESFEDRFDIYEPVETSEEARLFLDRLNAAFEKDWGVSLTALQQILYASIHLAVEQGNSVAKLPLQDFTREIQKITGLTTDHVEAGMQRLTLEQRPDFMVAPDGFKNEEVFPWKYNREFSLIRRPFVKFRRSEEETLILWGMRQAAQADRQLYQLLHNGRLKYGGSEINSLLGERNEARGKVYRNSVKSWFKRFNHLQVYDHEITLSPNGHLRAEKNLGDVDVMVFDKVTKVVYSIECKRTQQAKNAHEMKKELDSYLGRSGGKGMIHKHVERHKWLTEHAGEVARFLGEAGPIHVRSLLLTSDVVPIIYLKAGELPLPILSYPELKRKGLALLDTVL